MEGTVTGRIAFFGRHSGLRCLLVRGIIKSVVCRTEYRVGELNCFYVIHKDEVGSCVWSYVHTLSQLHYITVCLLTGSS